MFQNRCRSEAVFSSQPVLDSFKITVIMSPTMNQECWNEQGTPSPTISEPFSFYRHFNRAWLVNKNKFRLPRSQILCKKFPPRFSPEHKNVPLEFGLVLFSETFGFVFC